MANVDKLPRRKQRGINRKFFYALKGGELTPRPRIKFLWH